MASRNNFKTFLKERKREYVLLFPFLTDSQIIAKLRRIWDTARANSNGTYFYSDIPNGLDIEIVKN